MSVSLKPNGRTRTTPPAKPADPPSLGVPPKLRRRPVGVVVSVATIVVGSLLGVWLWSTAGATSEVLAVRTLVHRGEVIDSDDLIVVRVGVDPAVRTVPASKRDAVAGQRAALDLSPGGLITPDALAATVLPGQGTSVVGIGLAPGMLPAEVLAPGDAVRVVQTPGPQGEITGTPVTVSAVVVGVHPPTSGDQTIVDVLVGSDVAADLAARAATGRVALVLDSRER